MEESPGSTDMLYATDVTPQAHPSTSCAVSLACSDPTTPLGSQGMPGVYRAAKRAFAALPLAARVARAALVLHGGLFRRPPEARGGLHRRKRRRPPPGAPLALGSLDDLRAASKVAPGCKTL